MLSCFFLPYRLRRDGRKNTPPPPASPTTAEQNGEEMQEPKAYIN